MALRDDESLWLYYGAWSRIEIPQTTHLQSGLGEQSELNWRGVVTALEACFYLLCCHCEIPDRPKDTSRALTIHGLVWLNRKYPVIPD
jgi:hypothetical protein